MPKHRTHKAIASNSNIGSPIASVARTCFVGSRLSLVDQGRAADLQNRSALLLARWRCFCCLGADLRAQTPAPTTADAYVQQFESSYHDVRSLRAEFTQTYTLGGRTRIEAGRVAFARGGLMRWDYQRPTEKLFVSDGKQVSLYIPEEHQLTRTPMKSSEDFRVPFELLLTRLNLRRVFARVEMADAALDHDPADHVLRAFPKKEFAEEYTDVLIELGPQFDMRTAGGELSGPQPHGFSLRPHRAQPTPAALPLPIHAPRRDRDYRSALRWAVAAGFQLSVPSPFGAERITNTAPEQRTLLPSPPWGEGGPQGGGRRG